MVIAIQGIKEEERASFEAWKQWDTRIDFPPMSILTAIYFPVEYDESLLKHCEGGGHSDNLSGAVWYGIKNQAIKAVLKDMDINNILCQCGLLMEWFSIELGIFPVISVESGRYIEYVENWCGSANEKVNELYWHGISLDRGRIDSGIRIVGADCGKQAGG